MPHVLVAGKIHESGLRRLREAPGITVEMVDDVSIASYAPFVSAADAILIRTQPMPATVIAEAPKLGVVARHGVGFDAVDVAALNARGIPLAIVGDVNSRSVAEHTMMLMLALVRRAVAYDARTRAGDWDVRNSLEAGELAGRRLLVLGFGRIGRLVASMAQVFAMEVAAYDPFVDAAEIASRGVAAEADLHAALASADVVSIHMPMASGKPVLGSAEIARMKRGAFLINTARGGIADETALAAALKDGALAGAGIDVFESEPPPPDHPLLASDRVLVSPHSATLTRECAERMAVAAAQNILDHFAGRLDPSLVVNASAIGLGGRRPATAK